MATSPDPRPPGAATAPDGRRIIDELPAAVAVTVAERDLVFEHFSSLVDDLFGETDNEKKG